MQIKFDPRPFFTFFTADGLHVARAQAQNKPEKGHNSGCDREQLVTKFIEFVLAGDLAGVQQELAAGADVNATDASGGSALALAALHGYSGIVNRLLAAGSDTELANAQGQTPLIHAADRGGDQVIAALIDAGARIESRDLRGKTALMTAVVCESITAITQLLAAGADPYAQDMDGFSALQLAAMYGKTRALRRLLDHSVDIRRSTANDWNPLPLALRYSHFDAASILLDAGADVNAPQPIGRVAPLKFAAGYGNAPMVQRLLKLGADPLATDEQGATALDSARHNMEATPSRRAAYAQIVRLLEAAIRGDKSKRDTETKRDSDTPGEDFFDYWRENRVASMTLVDLHEDGALYYYESPYSCTVWVFAGVDSLIISYSIKGDGPNQVRVEVRRLLDVLHGRGDPVAMTRSGYPNYAAIRNPGTGTLTVACFHPGDWCGLTSKEPLPVHWDQFPGGWPEAYRSRLAELGAERIDIAERSSSFAIVNSVGRALVNQSKHSEAERLFRRALAICEKTVGTEHTDTASSLQAIGVTLAFQAEYTEAEEMLRRALATWILVRGPEHPNVASALNSIGGVLERQGNLSEANTLRGRAQAILEKNQAQAKT